MAERIGGDAPRVVARNIEEVVRLEEEAVRRRPPSSRIADLVAGFAGTLGFVLLHTALIATWAGVNAGLVPAVPAFDPYPFGLLGMLFSLEGVLLASFVLMKQNRMSALAEQRSHLDLQISLLAEQEVTKIIQMLEHISARLNIEREAMDAEAREMAEVTAVGGLAHQLREKLPDDTWGPCDGRPDEAAAEGGRLVALVEHLTAERSVPRRWWRAIEE